MVEGVSAAMGFQKANALSKESLSTIVSPFLSKRATPADRVCRRGCWIVLVPTWSSAAVV